MGLCLLALPLIKVSGFGLALLICGVIAVDVAVSSREGDKPKEGVTPKDGVTPRRASRWKRWLLPVGWLSCVLAGEASWRLYLSARHVAGGSGFSLQSVLRLFSAGLEPYQRQAAQSLWNGIFSPSGWADYAVQPLWVWLVGIGALSALLGRWGAGRQARRYRNAGWTLCGALLLYTVSLLAMYWFTFSPTEAAGAFSCQRYLTTPLVMALSVMLGLTVDSMWREGRTGWMLTVALSGLLFINAGPQRVVANTVQYQRFIRGAELSRLQRAPKDSVLECLSSETDKVYLLMQNDEDHAWWMNHYAFTPVKVHREDGEPETYWRWIRPQGALAGAEEAAAQPCAPEEWMALLREGGYTHVYVYQANEALVRGFGQLFLEPEKLADGTLFRLVEKQGQSMLEFVTD